MKWKSLDIGYGCYYITGTFTEWLPLLDIPEVRRRVCDDITAALAATKARLVAFVLMPTHVHLLVHLPAEGELHRFLKLWRGRSGRHIPRILAKLERGDLLATLARHANGGCTYATWKEQARSLSVVGEAKLREKIGYIHANPVRRGLVDAPGEWECSSYRFYEEGQDVCLAVAGLPE